MELLLVIAGLCNAASSEGFVYSQKQVLGCQQYYLSCLKKTGLSVYEHHTTYARERLVKCIEDRKID